MGLHILYIYINNAYVQNMKALKYIRMYICMHWRRLGKNIGRANQNIGGGQKVVKSDKCMGDSQLLGGHVPGLPP